MAIPFSHSVTLRNKDHQNGYERVELDRDYNHSTFKRPRANSVQENVNVAILFRGREQVSDLPWIHLCKSQ